MDRDKEMKKSKRCAYSVRIYILNSSLVLFRIFYGRGWALISVPCFLLRVSQVASLVAQTICTLGFLVLFLFFMK